MKDELGHTREAYPSRSVLGGQIHFLVLFPLLNLTRFSITSKRTIELMMHYPNVLVFFSLGT